MPAGHDLDASFGAEEFERESTAGIAGVLFESSSLRPIDEEAVEGGLHHPDDVVVQAHETVFERRRVEACAWVFAEKVGDDEPSLGLAPFMVREIFRIITSLRDAGVSILLVEQNARAALAVAEYGYVLENGAITLEGPTSELSSNSRIVDSYLGRAGAHQPAIS